MKNATFKINFRAMVEMVSLIIFSIIGFSIIGIAAITGQMTPVNSETRGFALSPQEKGITPNIMPTFVEKRASAPKVELTKPCANCAVVDSSIVNDVKENGGRVSRIPSSVADGQTATLSPYLVKVRMDDVTHLVVSQ